MALHIGFSHRPQASMVMPPKTGSKALWVVARRVHCTAAPPPPPKPDVQGSRRSANYKPSSWDYDRLQSLKSDWKVEVHAAQFEELKEKARLKILEETEVGAKLELVNALQRLGLGYHFNEEIKKFLGSISIEKTSKVLKGDLYATSLLFRLLREHGFQVSQDVFRSFKDRTGSFIACVRNDIHGMLSLYEASHLAFEGESTLDEARDFTTKHLRDLKPYMRPHLMGKVAHALELPLHRRTPRLEARWYIEQYERDEGMDPVLLQLAKLDFNKVQSIHQSELKRMTWWWKKLGIRENLSFARDRLIECFFFAMGVVSDPQLVYPREQITKVASLITTIDDVYDIYGSFDELQLFTSAISRWETSPNEGLPEYMKICYYLLYNTMNEMIRDNPWHERSEALPYLKKAWADLCTSFLVEAEWHSNGYTLTLREYLDNGWMSVSGHVILLHAIILSRQRVTMETLQCLQNYPSIIRSSSMIFRLCNDLATSSAELERGDVPTSIQCYMCEYGVSEAAARKAVNDLIDQEWKKLNKECMDCCPLPWTFSNASLNLARIAHHIYMNGDGIGAPDHEKRNQVISIFFEPLAF